MTGIDAIRERSAVRLETADLPAMRATANRGRTDLPADALIRDELRHYEAVGGDLDALAVRVGVHPSTNPMTTARRILTAVLAAVASRPES